MLYIPGTMMLEKVSKALADKNRLKIIQYLSTGQRNVSEVADRLNVEENLASHHLRVLAALGFLKNDKKGREVYYRINETRFVALLKDLNRSKVFKDILLKALED
ncbi:TPA: ArsR family transcriptional regulator [candidate division WWE3 bacterium]|uniref:ArsR family transcriptional regulator n=2 Tax=Katanobacteria TaxID=422282 RepID=A0A3D0ZQK4_UNCKA|nr:ArsR family transcriptional regulator [candidate division WWE3 bacterium]HCC42557.1 ArsR family transcriptional regulator [candidate division WWE3 bacterium]